MLACSFLIESSSKLLVTRTGIKARSSSILGRIRRLILELLALEWQKIHTFELEHLWSQLANLDQILCVASLGWGKGCIGFWADWITQVSDRCPLGYLFSPLSVSPFFLPLSPPHQHHVDPVLYHLSPGIYHFTATNTLFNMPIKIKNAGRVMHKMSRLVTNPTEWHVRPAKTQISLGIRPVWSESSLCA